jgi:putative transposase
MSDVWYSAQQLAGLPGMPGHESNVRLLAKKNLWPTRPKARGKGVEYPISALPQATRAALLTRIAAQSPISSTAPVPPIPAAVPVGGQLVTGVFTPASQLKDWQRRTAEARSAVVAEVKRLAAMGGTENAIRALVGMAATGTLPDHLQPLVTVANAKAGQGGGRALSRSSIYRWMKDAEAGFTGLAPKTRDENSIPDWAPALLSLWQQPQKPALAAALDRLHTSLPPHILPPSYSQARRFLDKMSARDREAGRMGSREIKNIRAYVKRDSSQMWPGDAYTADGHTLDAEVAHPAHGRAFRPELTTVIDIATRRAVGWSAGLAESTWSVLDALRHACLQGGIPAIFYVDNGSGFKNALMANEATGFMSRLSISLTHSLPYNSQARGVIERSHQTIWVKGAQQLPTYMGAPMDRQAKQKVYKLTRADIKATGTSRLLMAWADFITWCEKQVEDYNNKPHRGLPRIRDAATGKLRHQTPMEAWQQAGEEGWQPTLVLETERDDLFRPYKEAITRRALVQVYGNSYFHRDLEHYHGETVRVGYDIHDASRVWVRDRAGRLICVAEFEGNKRSYFPQSFIEQAAQKRAEGRIKRAAARIEEAEAELQPSQLLEYQPADVVPLVMPAQRQAITVDNVVRLAELEEAAEPARPMFETDAAKYRWLLRNPECTTRDDDGWIAWYRTSSEWEDLFGDSGDFEVASR